MGHRFSLKKVKHRQPEREANKPKSNRVLLVDDNPDHLSLFRILLEEKNYKVMCAEGAADAFSKLEEGSVDIIVCDVMMPDVSGQKFVEEVRLNESYADVPIIMITAGEKESEVDLLFSGADMFCPKGQAKKLLLSQIKLLLE